MAEIKIPQISLWLEEKSFPALIVLSICLRGTKYKSPTGPATLEAIARSQSWRRTFESKEAAISVEAKKSDQRYFEGVSIMVYLKF